MSGMTVLDQIMLYARIILDAALIALLALMILSVCRDVNISVREKLILIAIGVLVFGLTFVCRLEFLPFPHLLCTSVGIVIFVFLIIYIKYAKEHKRALLAESRIQIMISQIQPHFLYNTLASIQALCATDPPKAAKTVEMFAGYLRQNLESLSDSDLIPLNKELEHTRIYTQIELLMFPEIEIVYRINDQSFMIPALTIQPLVENSIRHGVRGITDPRVTVSTRKEADCHIIVISDNGRGFNAADEAKIEGRHIGIRNVRERVEQMCGGSLEVESSPGQGCTITIRIPVKKDNSGEASAH